MVKYLHIFVASLFLCNLHANPIDAVLAKYERAFTFLGLGQNIGFTIENSALSYPDSVFITLDKNPGNIENLALLNNAVWLNHELSFQEAKALASCEHVDVLLLQDILPTFGENWQEALAVFQTMAHVVIVSSANTYYVLEGKEPFPLMKTTLIHPKKRRWSYETYCSYTDKYLKKHRPNWIGTSPWFPGINMMTYLMFNGAIPSRIQILENIPIDHEHDDWVPNNMIVQGSTILLIDKDDPASTPLTDDGGERIRRLDANARKFITTTSGMSPKQVRETFISIYNLGNCLDQDEIEE